MYKCKQCGIEFIDLPSKYASGEFCSKRCARKFSSLQNDGGTKPCKCIRCGNECVCSKHTSLKIAMCKACSSEREKERHRVYSKKIIKRQNKQNRKIIHKNVCLCCGKVNIRNLYCSLECFNKHKKEEKY